MLNTNCQTYKQNTLLTLFFQNIIVTVANAKLFKECLKNCRGLIIKLLIIKFGC